MKSYKVQIEFVLHAGIFNGMKDLINPSCLLVGRSPQKAITFQALKDVIAIVVENMI